MSDVFESVKRLLKMKAREVNTATFTCSASYYAIGAHTAKGQFRKGSNEPYWIHCFNVATIVGWFNLSKAAVKAAWLHDTVEDTDVTLNDLSFFFSDSVCKYVEELTDVKFEGNRAERHAQQVERLLSISYEGKCIKLIDSICNMLTIVEDDIKFAPTYIEEKALFITQVKEVHPVILDLALETLEHCRKVINERKEAA